MKHWYVSVSCVYDKVLLGMIVARETEETRIDRPKRTFKWLSPRLKTRVRVLNPIALQPSATTHDCLILRYVLH